MSLFSFFTNLNHPKEKKGWEETTAVFTGKVENAAVGRVGRYHPAAYNEYEIRYWAAGEERYGWYVFHPLEGPDAEEIKGTGIRIRYHRKRPWLFEAI